MIVFEGEALTYTLPLKVDGDIVVPDEDTVSYTLHSHTGTVILTGTSPTSVIEISGDYHSRNAEMDFEKRTIITRFVYGGRPYVQKETYRVVPFLNYSTTAQDVRDFIGIDAQELPDGAVDLFKVYTKLVANFTDKTVFEAALVSGTIKELQANEALCMMAVLEVIPSLKQRVMYFEADGILQYRRQTIKDFNDLELAARNRLSSLIVELSADVIINSYSLIDLVSSQKDMVTGA